MKNKTVAGALAFSATAALALAPSAYAHHPMGGATPSNLFEGLASGLGHPVIGLDHLLFILAVGVACYYFGRRAGTVAAFIAGTLAGTVVHLYKATLPYPDVWVALSLVALGILFFRGHGFLRSKAALGIFALSGIAHGYAYGEAIVGAEPTPLAAYLVGFTLVQLAIVCAGYAIARYAERREPGPRAAAAVGGALSVAGVAFLALSLV